MPYLSRTLKAPALGAALAILALPFQTAAAASEATPTLETVFVMGKRQPYRGDFDALETPQMDLVLDAALLARAGALDLDRALDLSASTARQNNFGGLWNAFAVRGFVGDENLPSNYLVNGFNAGRGFGGPRELAGVESVEVLKGPRAALFGRGEPGGTVNLVTKRPQFEEGGAVRLAAGRFATYRADADYELGLSEAGALRLVGFYEDAESFRDTVETERYGFMPSLAWRVGEATELVYELELSRQELPFDRGVVALNNELGVVPRSRFLGEPGDGPMVAEVLGHQFEVRHDLSSAWALRLGYNHRATSLAGFSTEPELSGSRQGLALDGQTLTRQRRSRDYDATYEVFRGELSGAFQLGGLQHRVILGMDRDEFENDLVMLRARAPSLASQPSLAQLQAINILQPVYG
jgi:iron complex outermembrane receptor protein